MWGTPMRDTSEGIFPFNRPKMFKLFFSELSG